MKNRIICSQWMRYAHVCSSFGRQSGHGSIRLSAIQNCTMLFVWHDVLTSDSVT